MESLYKKLPGILVCLAIAIPSYLLGKFVPVVGGAIFSILIGMVIATFWKEKGKAAPGIKFTSKFVLQLAVVLLGFGLNLNVIMQTGKQSLPIIICTIATSLVTAFVLHKALSIHKNTSVLIGVGSSICGDANDEEVAQSISVIFFFNVLAAIIFPILGKALGFDTLSGDAFGIFAGTAVNDTSSVTAAAATWDSMWNLGTQTLDKAVTVKLTRTLAIIPITLILAIYRAKKEQAGADSSQKQSSFSIKRAFPMFILYFVLASVVTTIAVNIGVSADFFAPLKTLSKFFIVMAMAAIGLNSNIVKLVKTGGKPLILGACCWAAITVVSIIMQHLMGLI